MKRKNQNLEIVQIETNTPFFMRIHKRRKIDEYMNDNPRLLEHWHKELEINYIIDGEVDYYIDGILKSTKADDIVIINCESIHRVVPKPRTSQKDKIAFTLIVEYNFLKAIIPDLDDCVFVTDDENAIKEIKKKLQAVAKCYDSDCSEYKNTLILGLVYEMIYYMCDSRVKKMKSIIPINSQKNVERLRGILQFVEEHYKEVILQEETAKQFYFSREYFSRFFKDYTGITFKEYLTRYRIKKAEEELLYTEKSMTEIAMDTGFSDIRQFINAFKKYFKTTPYQYKMILKKRNK